jgi:hypothetical protein
MVGRLGGRRSGCFRYLARMDSSERTALSCSLIRMGRSFTFRPIVVRGRAEVGLTSSVKRRSPSSLREEGGISVT